MNADDFGATSGINRGIIEAHERGIVTSASLMVDRAASSEAAELAALHPQLGLGLHVDIPSPTDLPEGAEPEVERQLARFVELAARPPTHLDSHHHVHRGADLLPAFLAVAEREGLPLRDYCGVRHIETFYGRPEALAEILATELADGFNELCCHPGYVDSELVSSYTAEREAELAALCDPAVAALLGEEIRLATFRELGS